VPFAATTEAPVPIPAPSDWLSTLRGAEGGLGLLGVEGVVCGGGGGLGPPKRGPLLRAKSHSGARGHAGVKTKEDAKCI